MAKVCGRRHSTSLGDLSSIKSSLSIRKSNCSSPQSLPRASRRCRVVPFISAALWQVDLERFATSKVKLNELFLQWLSLGSTQDVVTSLLNDIYEGKPLNITPSSPRSPGGAPSSPR